MTEEVSDPRAGIPDDPKFRVVAIENMIIFLCQSVGAEPADGLIALMTATAHIASRCIVVEHASATESEKAAYLRECLIECLDDAIAAVDTLFGNADAAPEPQQPETTVH